MPDTTDTTPTGAGPRQRKVAAGQSRLLPAVTTLTEVQQRGGACVWCQSVLGIGLGDDLGEQRVRPADGAAYSWFPRQCPDAVACLARETS